MAHFKTSDVVRELPDEVFTVECESGESYQMRHPKLVSGLELAYMSFSDIPGALQSILQDDYAGFMNEPEIDGFALDGIFDAYLAHYGVPVNRGNGPAQRGPSTSSRKKSKPTSSTGTRARTR